MNLVLALWIAAAPWVAQPPMPHARSAHNVVATRRGIFVIGGSGEGHRPVLAVDVFDGRTWRTETQLPGDGLNAPASAVIGHRIYVVGGFAGLSNVPTDRVLVYDLSNRRWSEAAPLPAARGGHGIAVLDGKIHVVGGGNSKSTIADHTVYDPATNTWRAAAPLKFARGSPAVVAFDGKLWSIGGRSGYADFGDVDIYDAATDSWRPGRAIPARGTVGAVVYRGAIHIFGGEIQATKTVTNEVLRLEGDGWRAEASMPTARNYARAVVYRNAVYVLGGNPAAAASHSAEGSAIVEKYVR